MSSALQLIVLGQVYFFGPGTNFSYVTPNLTPTPTIDQHPTQPEPIRGSRRDDYTYTPGIGGHKVHTYGATWNAARKTCASEGGHLAIINSVTESKLIGRLFKESQPHSANYSDVNYAHIGFHDLFEEGDFVTVHGEPLRTTGFYEWHGAGPDNDQDGQNCGAVGVDGKLDDNSCHAFLSFVCELPYVARDSS